MAAGSRKGISSPMKKIVTPQTLIKSNTSTTMNPGASASLTGKIGAVVSSNTVVLSRIVELMMDKICPMNLAASEGLGADNMTCIVIEFVKSTSSD